MSAGLGAWIDRLARNAGESAALVYGETQCTYAEFAARVRRLASGLRSRGIRRGDRIAWQGPNHPAFLETLFAAAKLGAILAPINHRLAPAAIEEMLNGIAPRVVLSAESVSGLIADAPDLRIDEAVSVDDVLLLPFTSGTTGFPKGVMLTHGNITWNVVNMLSRIAVSAGDVTIASVPFFRTGGTGVVVLPVLFRGGTIVIPVGTAADEIIELVERHGATIGFGNPDQLEALTRSPRWGSADFTSLRTLIVGGAPPTGRLLATWHARGVNLAQGYGLSEAGPVVSLLDSTSAMRKTGSAGRPLPFVETRVEIADGSKAAAGEIGELLVRGPNVMAGYWKHPDATATAIDPDGWLRTGDAARVDDDGFLFIVGRMEDAYVSGGEIVHPVLVERVLLTHPRVVEACVVGGDGGATAYVVPADDVATGIEDELVSLCAQRLATPARPTAIQVVSSLPRNSAGKVLRHELPQPLIVWR